MNDYRVLFYDNYGYAAQVRDNLRGTHYNCEMTQAEARGNQYSGKYKLYITLRNGGVIDDSDLDFYLV